MSDITLSELNEMVSRLPNPNYRQDPYYRVVVPRQRPIFFHSKEPVEFEPLEDACFVRRMWRDGHGRTYYRWTINREIVV